MGDQLHARRRELVNGLQPNRLPDAAARRVPVPLRLVALLADGLRAVVRRVVHRDDQLVVAVLQVRRHVERERIVSAFVSALSLAVQIDVALPVDGVEVEPDVPPVVAPAFRQPEHAAVLEIFGALHDARKRGLDGERHENLARELPPELDLVEDYAVAARPFVRRNAVGDAARAVELPHAVEVHPLGAHHLRTRIFRQHVLRRHVVRPGRHERRRLLLPAERHTRREYRQDKRKRDRSAHATCRAPSADDDERSRRAVERHNGATFGIHGELGAEALAAADRPPSGH